MTYLVEFSNGMLVRGVTSQTSAEGCLALRGDKGMIAVPIHSFTWAHATEDEEYVGPLIVEQYGRNK